MNEPTIKIGEIKFGKLIIPIRQLTAANRYNGGAIADEDLPEGLAQEFGRYMICAACPGRGYAYLHDFIRYMGSRGLKGEVSWDNKT